MADRTIRQRKGLSERSKRDDDTCNTSDEAAKKIVTCSVFRTIIIGVILALVYANYSSPITAKIIKATENNEALHWASVHNNDLERGVRILQNLHGPESVAVSNATGCIFTGTHDGKIVRICDIDAPSPIVTDVTAQLKNGPYYSIDGNSGDRRPLGLRLQGNQLYVADAYQGIFAIDLDSNTWEKIVGANDVIPQLMFADDLVLNSDGTKLYFTDMSEKWPYNEMAYSVVEGDCTGRVIEVDLKTKITTVLRRDLCFPNGIELNPDGETIIVSESQRSRLILLDKESGEILREIPMPGSPDNIRRSNTGGYWVSIPAPTVRFTQLTRSLPFFRNIAAKILGPKGLYIFLDVSKGMVVKLDDDYVPISVYKDSQGKVSRMITEVAELEDGFLLCSFLTDGLVKFEQLPVVNNIVQAT